VALKLVVLCASFAVGVVGFTTLFGARHEEAVVQASATARWRQEGESVKVERGLVRIRPRGREAVAVVTPQLEAMVQNAAALFDVTARSTVLKAESGEVSWRAAGKSGTVQAGQSVTLGLPVARLSMPPRGVPLESCTSNPESRAYTACLAKAAEGSGLTAETALYELAVLAHERGELDEATRLFRAYGERFPEGVFAPEASIGLMIDLEQAGKPAEAAAEAARFPVRFSGEPRIEDVRRWAEQIP